MLILLKNVSALLPVFYMINKQEWVLVGSSGGWRVDDDSYRNQGIICNELQKFYGHYKDV